MVDNMPGAPNDLGLLPEEELFEETLCELSGGRGDEDDD